MPVLGKRRPAGEDEAPTTWLQRASDIAEGGHRVSKEHDAHARCRDVECSLLECQHLRIAKHQCDVVHPALAHSLPCGAEHRLGDVDRDDAAMFADSLCERQG